jgi:oxygen-independent coproporphyrinogen-3 oxidase
MAAVASLSHMPFPTSPHTRCAAPILSSPSQLSADILLNHERSSRVRNVYFHVPFCGRKCAYCAFYSEPGSRDLMARYVRGLCREMDSLAATLDRNLETLFFGGGTPSLLPIPLWEEIINHARRLGFAPAHEWTVECNPATLSRDKARFLRDQGVNRVSLGVQSLDERILDRLGRIHSRQAVFDSFDLLRHAGFDNINLDLMFGIPGQTLELWTQTLDAALALEPEHLACYELIYEEDTPLYLQLAAGTVRPDEDLAAAMYDLLIDRAAQHGLFQYEIANFARHLGPGPAAIPDRACRHNVNYWRGGSFLGLGPSACGFVGEIRTRNCADTDLYCSRLEQGQLPRDDADALTPLARAGEIAAFGLRMTRGWLFDEFRSITGFDLRRHWLDAMRTLVREGLGLLDHQGFRLTPRGLRFADAAAQAFLR